MDHVFYVNALGGMILTIAGLLATAVWLTQEKQRFQLTNWSEIAS